MTPVIADTVARALETGGPVVALESTIITHGMPYPANVETAVAVEADVRANGAVPATLAVVDGRLRVGLDGDELDRLGQVADAHKVSRRDLAFVLRSGAVGGTTVAATIAIGYIPFAGVGIEALTEGFRRYAGEWRRNDGAYAILAAITPRARVLYAVIAGTVAIGSSVYLLRRESSTERFILVLQITLLCWFLLLPAPYPWYAVSILALAALRPSAWAVVLSGALAVYYYSFIHEYRSHPDVWLAWSQFLEHAAVWIALAAPWAVQWLYHERRVTPFGTAARRA